jgi:Arc/MetJ-type ribon-helix-helix transcriptional regulator
MSIRFSLRLSSVRCLQFTCVIVALRDRRESRISPGEEVLTERREIPTPMTNKKKPKRRRTLTHVQLLTVKDFREREEKREQDFLRRWRAHLDKEKREKAWAAYWQDLAAIAEMKDKGCFVALRAASTERDRIFWMLLFREVAIYRSNYASWVRRNQEFEGLNGLLDSLVGRLKKFQSKSDLTRQLLDDILDVLQREVARIPEKRCEFQSNALYYTPEELSKPFVPVSSIKAEEPEFQYAMVADVAKLDRAAYNWKIPKIAITKDNLDTRLQGRLGALFHLFYSALSWRTISRLIVLVYITAGLAGERGGKLSIWPGAKPRARAKLSVRMMEKKLQKLRPDKSADPDAFFRDWEKSLSQVRP